MAENTNTNPIYILGTTSLSFYFAAKFLLAGENVILLSNPADNKRIENTTYTLKEDTGIKQNHLKFQTSFLTQTPPKLLIIASGSEEINTDILLVTKQKIQNSPIISFTPLENKTYIEEILGKKIISAWFDGWLNLHENHIELYGTQPEICILTPSDTSQNEQTKRFFSTIGIKSTTAANSEDSFWIRYIIYACGSLLSSSCNKNILQITKNKNLNTILEKMLSEALALHDFKQEITLTDIMNKIKTIPSGYTYPLHQNLMLGRRGDFDTITNFLEQKSRQTAALLPTITDAAKQIYNRYLSIN